MIDRPPKRIPELDYLSLVEEILLEYSTTETEQEWGICETFYEAEYNRRRLKQLVDAVRKETMNSSRNCCNAKCRNKEVACPGEMELHWVCTRCGHQHHATKKDD